MKPSDVPIRPASTVTIVRGDEAPEVLLLLRHGQHGFMPNMWVFPGGRVDECDGVGPDADEDVCARRAAIRETAEEAGLTLGDAGALAYFARWVTPLGERRRFDTRFYLGRVPADTAAVPDQGEVIDALWVSPQAALERHLAGTLALAPPTWWVLEALSRLGHGEAIGAWARAVEAAGVRALTPSLVLEGGTAVVYADPTILPLPPGAPVSGRLRLERGAWRPVSP